MIIPKLPAYLTGLGGAEYKGLIISLFTITAMISRPFSGKIADKVGRIPVMVIGTSVCVIISILYPIISILVLFGIKETLVHKQGFSTQVFKIHKRDLLEPKVLITCRYFCRLPGH